MHSTVFSIIKKSTLLLIMLLNIFLADSYGQVNYSTPSTTATTGLTPLRSKIGVWYRNTDFAGLATGQTLTISKMAWDVSTLPAGSISDYRIYIRTVSGTPPALSGNPATGNTLVYSGTYNPTSIGWQEITLNNTFTWNTNDWLLVYTCHGSVADGASFFFNGASAQRFSSSGNPDCASPSGSGSAQTGKPSLRISASAACNYASTQASSFSADVVNASTINISFTRGNGSGGVMVIAKEGSPVNAVPVDGVTYTANANFGSGTQLGTGNFVVFSGTANGINNPSGNITITGLNTTKNYFFSVFEFNTGPCYKLPELSGTSACSFCSGFIGTGSAGPTTSNFRTPFRTSTPDARFQYYYSATELGSSGCVGIGDSIFGIGFNVTSVDNTVMNFFNVSLKNTPCSSGQLSCPASNGEYENGATLCYSGTYQVTSTGWNMIYFNQGGFAWDGVSNIMVEICWTNGVAGSANSGVEYDITQFCSVNYDNQGLWFTPDVGCGVAFGGCNQNRPRIRFDSAKGNLTTTVTPATPSICSGQSVSLTASGATSYTWSPATGLSCTNCANPTANPASTTTYTVIGTSGSCTDTSTVTVTVASNLSVNVSPSSPTVCSGQSVSLTASGATSYTWSPATGLSCTNCANPTANPTITTTYTVTGIANGCSSTATTTITVNAKPDINISPTLATICSGQSVSLTASGATSYTWSPATGLSCTNCANPTANPASTTTYTVIGTSGSCTDTSTVTVTVASNLSVNVSPSSPTVCSGQSVSLTASGATSYTWSPATGLSCTNCANPTANPASTTTYTVIGTSGSCADTSTVTVTVGISPTVNISPSTAAICIGESVSLTASGATSYTWSPATDLSCTNCANPTANPTVTTTYTVTGTTNGCSSTATTTVTVNSNPNTNISPSSATICNGESVSLTASGATSYTWSPATGLSCTNCANPTANPSSTTTYTVIGAENGCSSTASITVTLSNSLSVNVTPTAQNICTGESISFTASGATSYTWSPATGLSCTNCANPTANPSSTTSYTVIGTSGSCSDTTTVTVSVSPCDCGTLSVISTTPTNTNSCVFVSSASSGSTGSNFRTPFRTSTPDQRIQYIYSACELLAGGANGPAELIAIGFDVTQADNTPMNFFNVSVKNVPWSLGFNMQSFESGMTNVYTGSYTVTGTGWNMINFQTPFQWDGNSNLLVEICWTNGTAGTGNSSINYSQTGLLQSVFHENQAGWPIPDVGCGTAFGGAHPNRPWAKFEFAQPNIQVAVTPSSDTICSGESISLTASGATSYTWSPATGLSCTNCPNPTATPTTNTTYQVIGIAGNCADTASVSITVVNAPVVNASPVNETICEGASLQLSVSGATSYTWSPATGLSCTNCPNPVATPLSTTVYEVIGTTAGCSDTATVNITVEPKPIIFITPSTPVICPGESVSLTASGATSYVWSPATGLSCTNCANPSANPTATTTYTVIGISGNCADTSSVTVTVNASLTVSISPPNSVLCSGDSVVLTASGASSYDWSPADGLNTISGETVIAKPNSTTTYTVVGSSGSCNGTDSATITVLNKPDSPLVNISSDTICEGSSAIITVTGAPSGVVNNVFLTASGGSSIGTTPLTVSPELTTTYYVQSEASATCISNSRTPVTLTVVPGAAIPIISVSNAVICKGDTVIITASDTTGTLVSYNYYTAPVGGSIISQNPLIAVPDSTVTYYLEVQNSFGCLNSSGRIPTTITVNYAPVITTNEVLVCFGASATITVNVLPENSIVTWWSELVAGDLLNTGTNYTLSNVTDNTIIYIEAESTNGCNNVTDRQEVNVSVTNLPIVSITGSSQNNIILPDDEVVFTATPDNYDNYEFLVNNVSVQNSPLNTFTATELANGDTIFVIATENLCVGDTAYIVVSIKDYPNAFTPNNDGKNDFFLKGYDLVVLNRWGQELYKGNNGWDGTYKGRKVSPGTYFYVLTLNNAQGNEKVVKGTVLLIKD